MPSQQAAVLFADLDGFTALTFAHGDLDAVDVATRFADTAARLLTPGARLVKTLGDAVMITAPHAADVLGIGERLIDAIDAIDRYPSVSAGAHVGPVIERDGDVYGNTVNVAARVAALARPRQLLCTEEVVQRLDATQRDRLQPLGSVELANLPDPVELFAVVDHQRRDRPVDPVCRMQVEPRDAVAWIRQGTQHYFCSDACLRAYLAQPARYGPVS